MKKIKVSMPYKQGGSSYGIVPGQGNPKADDKQMLAKEGHVVPAENTPIAMNLVSMMGYDPMQNVSMQQGGGTPINISSGEYFLNKEQVAKLKAQGINPEMLSPNSPYNEGEEGNADMNSGGKVRFTMPTQEDQNNNQQSSHGNYNHGGPHDDNGTYEDDQKKLKPVDYTKAGRNTNQFMAGQGAISGGSSEADAIRLYGSTEMMRKRMRDEDPNFDFGNDVYGPKHADAFNKLNILYAQNPEKWQNGPGEKYGPPANQTATTNTNANPVNVDMKFGIPDAPIINRTENITYPDPAQPALMDLQDISGLKTINEKSGINPSTVGPENYVGQGTNTAGDQNQQLYDDLLNKSKNLTDLETMANVGMGLWNLSRERQPLNKPGLAPVREITRDYKGMENEMKQNVAKQTASNAYTLRNLGNTNAMIGLDANAKASMLEGSGNIWDLQQQDTMVNVNAANQNNANYTNQMYDWGLREADAASKFQQAKGANIAQNVNQIFTVQDAGLNKEAQLRTFQNEYNMNEADSTYDSEMSKVASDPKFLGDLQKKYGFSTPYIPRMTWRNNSNLQADIKNYKKSGTSMASGGKVNLPPDLAAEKSIKDLTRTNFSRNSLLSLGQS